MPLSEPYTAHCKITMELRNGTGMLASYSVVRTAKGDSYGALAEQAEQLTGAIKVLEAALIDCTAAQKALAHGVQNAERRRLK